MSSQGEEEPPGNEGPHNPPFTGPPITPIEWHDLHVRHGYDLLEEIIFEQQRNLVVAIANNVKRHGIRDRVPDFTVAGSVALTGVLAGYPVIGTVIGVCTAIGKSVYETFRIRRNAHASDNQAVVEVRKFMLYAAAHMTGKAALLNGETPYVREFYNLWVRSAWRLVHYLKGYNARFDACAETLNGHEATSEETAAAYKILGFLGEYRPRLIHVLRVLEDIYVKERFGTKRLESMERFNDRLEEADPFDDRRKDLPGFDWLPLPHDSLIRAELPARAEKDRVAIDASMELYIQELDLNLAKHEPDYGPEVDLVLAHMRREEEENRKQAEDEVKTKAKERMKALIKPDSDDT